MAKQTNVNLNPTTGAVAMFEWSDFLVSSLGFEILEESDGSTYEADVPTNGRVITSGAGGAGGFANANAWTRIREPGGAGGREWTVQRDTANNTDWRIKFSSLDGFTGGSPGATQTPSAADEHVIFGSGSDASPTHTTFFGADGTYRFHLVGFDVAEDGVYPWYAFATVGGVPRTLWFVDSLDPDSYPALVGTRAAPTTGEPDPAMYVAAYHTGTPGSPFLVLPSSQQWGDRNNPPGRAWFAMNGSNGNTEAIANYSILSLQGSASFGDLAYPADAAGTDGLGPHPLDGSDVVVPVQYARTLGQATNVGPKGVSAHIKMKGVDRSYPDTLDISGERFVYAGHLLLPFENGATPL